MNRIDNVHRGEINEPTALENRNSAETSNRAIKTSLGDTIRKKDDAYRSNTLLVIGLRAIPDSINSARASQFGERAC
jgi:hypothetical protein